jgi:hypothetical protein
MKSYCLSDGGGACLIGMATVWKPIGVWRQSLVDVNTG